MRKLVVMGVGAALMVGAPASVAQVYKCSVNGTTMYSQTPCGPTSEIVETRKGPAVDRDALQAQRSDVFRSVDVRNAEYAEAACLRQGEARAWGPANDRIQAYEAQIASLNQAIGRANNNTAGATWESGMRSQIAGLAQAISTERSTASARMESERSRCAAELDRAVQKIDEQYKPAAPASN